MHKINMAPTKVPMPEQDPNLRNQNFSEVSLGYRLPEAIEEAQRCLQCKHKPCVSGCPVGVEIPSFIKQIIEGNLEGAYYTINATNALPAVCGRVCPQEKQCESVCVRGIKHEPVGIGRLERFVADWYLEQDQKTVNEITQKKEKVAVIGAGPAGLSCAGQLANLGYEVTIFEAFHEPGGVLVYGIPEFRLPKSIVMTEIEKLKAQGVHIETNMVIGRVLTISDLAAMGYQAFFIGTGAGTPKFMNIPGESLIGVYSANEYLTRINLMKAYLDEYDTPVKIGRHVAVVGGGNVAMDAARCAKRLGAEKVSIIYRRTEKEMPARLEEIHHAKQEGIEFRFLTNPVQILGNDQGEVVGIECVQMELGAKDETGRQKPIARENSNFVIAVDTVIMAIGTMPNPLLAKTTPGLITDKWGTLVVDDDLATSLPGVFAGGDIVTGAATVILAMGAGRKAALSIDRYLTQLREKGVK